MLSFVLSGLDAHLPACVTRFRRLIPLAGSAYTYAYATLGEFFACDYRLGPHAGIRHGRQHRFLRLVQHFIELLNIFHIKCVVAGLRPLDRFEHRDENRARGKWRQLHPMPPHPGTQLS